jgi:four helix bundle protein
MPKEIRIPKSDWSRAPAGTERDNSAFWKWGDEPGSKTEAMILRDEATPGGTPPRDLTERTAQFGEAIVRFVKKVPRGPNHPENNRLVDQLVGAGTSVGANYCEADDAVSGKDFKKSIGTCRKESKEAMFFLRMVAASEESLSSEARRLWREAKELNLIFGAIWRK